jgi:mRNA interferase RelE/StbE
MPSVEGIPGLQAGEEVNLAWTLRISETAKRQLRKLDASNAQAILRYLNRLILETTDPHELGSGLRANLAGLWRYRIGNYRIGNYRVGDYRVIFSIEANELMVMMIVLQIGHRRDAYK